VEACRESGCPVCRLEQHSVERYLDSQFYENVNSPAWRDQLRASLGFCHEHAWLGVNKRLGDALGFSIIYHDIVNSLLHRMEDHNKNTRSAPRGRSWLGQIPEAVRDQMERLRAVFTPRKRCPVCEHRAETTRNVLSALVETLPTQEMTDALQTSDGLCLPHLKATLDHLPDAVLYEKLLNLQRAKLEQLKAELAEFIRKNDYQVIKEGFGKEGDAWLRAISMVAGSRKER
jgi:hypothetical protein